MDNAEPIFGPMFIGLLVSAILFGITTIRSASFFSKGPREPLLHRLVVFGLWILDFLSTIFLAHTLYHYLIASPHDQYMPRFIWSCQALFAMESIIIFLAQSLYILRIWRLAAATQQHCCLTTTLVLASVATLVFGLYTTYRLHVVPASSRFDSLVWEVLVCLCLTCVTDFSISAVLIVFLAKQPKGTSWTDSTAVLLASYALNTGVFTSLFSIAAIISFACNKKSFAFLGIRIILSTVHINSLMAMLNAHRYFQKQTPSMVVLQSHEAWLAFSKDGEVHAARRRPTTVEKETPPTINEVGFPQFNKSPTTWNKFGTVEVVVAQEQSTTVSRTLPVPMWNRTE